MIVFTAEHVTPQAIKMERIKRKQKKVTTESRPNERL